MRLIIHPHAREDFSAAVRYYKRQGSLLGSRFAAACRAATVRILESPARHRRIAEDLHRVRLNRFPYSIVYQLDGSSMLIVAFAHDRRQQDYWRPRLSD